MEEKTEDSDVRSKTSSKRGENCIVLNEPSY